MCFVGDDFGDRALMWPSQGPGSILSFGEREALHRFVLFVVGSHNPKCPPAHQPTSPRGGLAPASVPVAPGYVSQCWLHWASFRSPPHPAMSWKSLAVLLILYFLQPLSICSYRTAHQCYFSIRGRREKRRKRRKEGGREKRSRGRTR